MTRAKSFPLETKRLILRPFAARDADAFARYRSDPDIARYQDWQSPVTLEQARAFIASLSDPALASPGEWYQVALEQKTTGQLVGDCAFQVLAEDRQQAEIGFSLAREFHGLGFATEAVTRLLDYLFANLRLHRVRANCDPENQASARVLARAGMRHEGRFVESLWFKGGWVGEDWYAILAREWQAGQSGFRG